MPHTPNIISLTTPSLPLLTSCVFLTALTLIGCGGDDYDEGNNTTNIESVRMVSTSGNGDILDFSTTISYLIGDDSATLKATAHTGDANEDYDDVLPLGNGEGTAELLISTPVALNAPLNHDGLITVESWLTANSSDGKSSGYAFDSSTYQSRFTVDLTRQINNLTAVSIEPIVNSYQTSINDEFKAKQHSFRFRVTDQNGLSIPGLQTDLTQYFSIIENGELADRETLGSGTEEIESFSTYFVIDASNSIIQAGSEAAVRESVSKTVASLNEVSDFFYHQFATDVTQLTSLRELSYSETNRFTSLYHAIDLTLDDIAGNPNAHQKIMIVFTDGDDNYSQNHYPNLDTKDAVYSYLLDRINSATASTMGGLVIYTIGLGTDIDLVRLNEIAEMTQGTFILANDEQELADKFSEIYGLIQSTYTLSYLSTNLGDVNSLVLRVDIENLSDEYEWIE